MKPVAEAAVRWLKRAEFALFYLKEVVLSNLVTMTPGTLSIDLSQDRERLAIHGMYVDDTEEIARRIEHDFVRRIRDVF